MGFPIYRLVSIGIFLISWTEFGSALRVVSEPEPFNNSTETLSISCITDDPTYSSIDSIRITNQDGVFIAGVNKRQSLRMGPGMKENMKAEGHVDTADASKSRLTLTIEKPARQDAGIYQCQVMFIDKNSNPVEEQIAGKVTFNQLCPDGWSFFNYDKTCIKSFGLRDDNSYLTWSGARGACQSYGGDLVQIRDAIKNDFVTNMNKGYAPFPWIGIKNNGSHFKYADGSDLGSYQPWGQGEPALDDGNCVFVSLEKAFLGTWRTYQCYDTIPYVCSISVS